MLEMIATLENKGLAYRGANGDVYYSVRSFARVRQALAPQPRRAARGRARRGGGGQARSARLRAVEGGQARRAEVALGVRRRAAGVAHRVLGDVVPRARRAVRHPRRRLGPAVPAPRERDRAERGRARQRLRELLDARRVPQHGPREDVEVARQLLHHARRARQARPGAGRRAAALLPHARPLPQRGQLHAGRRWRTRATRCAASTRRCARCRL